MYQLPKLLYLYQDFEPFIDTHTMGVHYHKHAKNYLNKLNALLEENNVNFSYRLSELFYHIDEFPASMQEDVLFNLGGVLNHILYWQGLSPAGKKPTGELLHKINTIYGDFDNFWHAMKDKALKLKGSGYTFLVVKTNNDLDIINLPNQDMPVSLGYIPLFNIDMWEHAYYLNYKNEKGAYLDNLKNVADFTYASKMYEKVNNSN